MGLRKVPWAIIDAELVSADLPGLLSVLGGSGVPIFRVRHLDSLTVQIQSDKKHAGMIQLVAKKYGASYKILTEHGILQRMKRIATRPILIIWVGILLFLTLWIPEKVLFVRVEGNRETPALEILEAAESCGITFGTSRAKVRSEAIKNSLLEHIPGLQWAGINTFGCTAVISVREREEEPKSSLAGTLTSLVAVRDGIIEYGTVTAGTILCKPGQAVLTGDVLISAYTDCGVSVRAQRARGEVFAFTVRPFSVATPLQYTQKGEMKTVTKNFFIIIGKKQINLSKYSGISCTTCDKIRREYVLTLPGGYPLPVSLVVETQTHWKKSEFTPDCTGAENMTAAAAREYVLGQMISGKILDEASGFENTEKLFQMKGYFLCNEMIARERNEEIIEEYGENRGEDR